MANTYMDQLIKEASAMADSLLGHMAELGKIMAEEIALVQANRIEALAPLVRQKTGITNHYQLTLKTLSGREDLRKALPQDRFVKLQAEGQKLAALAEQNGVLLQGAVRASARLVQNIFAVIKEEALPKQGYVNPMLAHMNTEHYSPTARSVIINRTA